MNRPIVSNSRAQRLPGFPVPAGSDARGADLRDLFAMDALNGLIAAGFRVSTDGDVEHTVDHAYSIAEAMMRRRAQ